MITITMPKLSHNVTDSTVTHWYRKEGDPVLAGEPLLEIERIKPTIDILAPGTGPLLRILGQVGETVACATILGEVSNLE